MQDERTKDEVLVAYMVRQVDGKIRTAINRDAFTSAGTLGYAGFGLVACDLVRNVAQAYGVSEDSVWEWVDQERSNPTTDVSKVRPA